MEFLSFIELFEYLSFHDLNRPNIIGLSTSGLKNSSSGSLSNFL